MDVSQYLEIFIDETEEKNLVEESVETEAFEETVEEKPKKKKWGFFGRKKDKKK